MNYNSMEMVHITLENSIMLSLMQMCQVTHVSSILNERAGWHRLSCIMAIKWYQWQNLQFSVVHQQHTTAPLKLWPNNQPTNRFTAIIQVFLQWVIQICLCTDEPIVTVVVWSVCLHICLSVKHNPQQYTNGWSTWDDISGLHWRLQWAKTTIC